MILFNRSGQHTRLTSTTSVFPTVTVGGSESQQRCISYGELMPVTPPNGILCTESCTINASTSKAHHVRSKLKQFPNSSSTIRRIASAAGLDLHGALPPRGRAYSITCQCQGVPGFRNRDHLYDTRSASHYHIVITSKSR